MTHITHPDPEQILYVFMSLFRNRDLAHPYQSIQRKRKKKKEVKHRCCGIPMLLLAVEDHISELYLNLIISISKLLLFQFDLGFI